MKIRLYRGPFNGKVFEHRDAGRNEILIRGPKPMSRKAQYLAQKNHFEKESFPPRPWEHPVIEATYRIVNLPRPIITGPISVRGINTNFAVHQGYCMHPDGSIFYEWVNPNQK